MYNWRGESRNTHSSSNTNFSSASKGHRNSVEIGADWRNVAGNKGPGGLLGEGPKTNPPPIQTTKEMPILIKQASMERSKPSKKDKVSLTNNSFICISRINHYRMVSHDYALRKKKSRNKLIIEHTYFWCLNCAKYIELVLIVFFFKHSQVLPCF
jgi:hypothetical protein